MNDIHARDAEYILERMFSFAAMWQYEIKIHVPYLALIAVERYQRERGDEANVQKKAPPIYTIAGNSLLMRYQQISSWTLSELQNEYRRSSEWHPILSAVLKEYAERFPPHQYHANATAKSYLAEYQSKFDEVGKLVNIVRQPDADEPEDAH